MAYLHCHNCGWSQDYFYSVDGYNPARCLKAWMEDLCSDSIDQDCKSSVGRGVDAITKRDVIVMAFEQYADRIRTMKWITEEQWKRDKDTAVCPDCGKRDLAID